MPRISQHFEASMEIDEVIEPMQLDVEYELDIQGEPSVLAVKLVYFVEELSEKGDIKIVTRSLDITEALPSRLHFHLEALLAADYEI